MYRKAATEYTTENVLDEVLGFASNTNGVLREIYNLQQQLHEAQANGDPVTDAANAVVSLLDKVRPHLEQARDLLIQHTDVLLGAGNQEAYEEPEDELPDEYEEEEIDEEP